MNIIDRVILSSLLLIGAACSSDPLAGPETLPPALAGVPEGPVELSMLISLGDNEMGATYGDIPAPRATPSDGEYDPGSGYENFIDISARDFALYIFTAGDAPALVAQAAVTGLVPADGGSYESSKTYTCRFRLDDPAAIFDAATGRASFRLVMLANWRAWPLASGSWADYPMLGAGASLDDLYRAASSTRSCPAGGTGPAITRETRIPLFGVQAYSGVDLAADGLTDLAETLHLLRAFAKIEVYDGPETQKAIESVTLTRSNTLFKALPSRVYDRADYVKGTHALDYVDHVSIPGDADDAATAAPTPVATDLPFFRDPQGNSGKGSWLIYVPEFDNTSAAAVPSRIRVGYGDGSNFLVDFKNYGQLTGMAKDEPFDIRRNNWYIYSINRREHNITVELDVQPYAECKMDASLGLLADDMGDLMVYMVDEVDSEGKPTGQLKLPDTFVAYLNEYHKSLPTDDAGNRLEYHPELGDYFAIHRLSDGTMAGSVVWLKDGDSDRVMTNFAEKDDNSQECSTRVVYVYDPTGVSYTVEYKDIDGHVRRQHNTDHSSLIYHPEFGLAFKTYPDKKIYEVESWDEDSGIFYVHFGDTDTHYVFREFNKEGKQTGTVIKVDMLTGERETLTGQDPITL